MNPNPASLGETYCKVSLSKQNMENDIKKSTVSSHRKERGSLDVASDRSN